MANAELEFRKFRRISSSANEIHSYCTASSCLPFENVPKSFGRCFGKIRKTADIIPETNGSVSRTASPSVINVVGGNQYNYVVRGNLTINNKGPATKKQKTRCGGERSEGEGSGHNKFNAIWESFLEDAKVNHASNKYRLIKITLSYLFILKTFVAQKETV